MTLYHCNVNNLTNKSKFDTNVFNAKLINTYFTKIIKYMTYKNLSFALIPN